MFDRVNDNGPDLLMGIDVAGQKQGICPAGLQNVDLFLTLEYVNIASDDLCPGLGISRVLNVLWPLMFAGLGLAIGVGISLAVNRKRGRSLKFIAAGSVLTAYLIMSFFGVVDSSIFGLLATAAGFYLAINKF